MITTLKPREFYTLVACFIYVFGIPVVNFAFFSNSFALIVAHEVLSALILIVVLLCKMRFGVKQNFENMFYMLAFIFCGIADLLYGFTHSVVLNSGSLSFSIYVREFSYVLFLLFLTVGLSYEYSFYKIFSNARKLIIAILTTTISVYSFIKIMVPLYLMPDSALVFVISGTIYMVFRSYLISFSLVMGCSENSLSRFIVLFAILQLLISDAALTFQMNTLSSSFTILNTWFERGWQISLAILAARALYSIKEKKYLGKSQDQGLVSIRSGVVFLVLAMLFLQTFFLWILDAKNFSNLMEITQILSLVMISWSVANLVAITISRQILMLSANLNDKNARKTSLIFQEVWHALNLQIKMFKSMQEKETLATIGLKSAQVAHDIRSPLAALDIALGDMKEVAEENRYIARGALQRIRDISNHLLRQQYSQAEELMIDPQEAHRAELLFSHTEMIVSEKRIQYRDRLNINIETKFDTSSIKIFSRICTTEYKRIISNLINNSVEAIGDDVGIIEISIKSVGNTVKISVLDNGPGITNTVLAKLGSIGVSFGKARPDLEAGSGIGIYHAKTTVESWQGNFEIESKLGYGTSINMLLPICQPPSWFFDKLVISPRTQIFIIDDEPSIHLLWDQKFKSLVCSTQIHHCMNPNDLREKLKRLDLLEISETIFLADYEYMEIEENGMSLLKEFSDRSIRVLVTSRFDDLNLQKQCSLSNIKLLPKPIAGTIEISIENIFLRSEVLNIKSDTVLLDNDNLIRQSWELAAKKNKVNLDTYANPKEFKNSLGKYSYDTKFYIDSNLDNGLKGEDLVKNLYNLGFKNLYIASGYPASDFEHLTFLKGVIGKRPPF